SFPAPHVYRPDPLPVHDADLLARLRDWGGTPPDVLNSPDMMRLLLPALRADLEMAGGYRYRPSGVLPCSLTALGGADDRVVSPLDLSAWSELTSDWRGVRLFSGDHFYFRTETNRVVGTLIESL